MLVKLSRWFLGQKKKKGLVTRGNSYRFLSWEIPELIYVFVEMVSRAGKTGLWYKRDNEIPGQCFREWNPNTSGD